MTSKETMTLGRFRALTRGLKRDTKIGYNIYDKGACIQAYRTDKLWLFPKGAATEMIVLNTSENRLAMDSQELIEYRGRQLSWSTDSEFAIMWQHKGIHEIMGGREAILDMVNILEHSRHPFKVISGAGYLGPESFGRADYRYWLKPGEPLVVEEETPVESEPELGNHEPDGDTLGFGAPT